MLGALVESDMMDDLQKLSVAEDAQLGSLETAVEQVGWSERVRMRAGAGGVSISKGVKDQSTLDQSL